MSWKHVDITLPLTLKQCFMGLFQLPLGLYKCSKQPLRGILKNILKILTAWSISKVAEQLISGTP